MTTEGRMYIAQLMRAGRPHLGESHVSWYVTEPTPCGCALMTAYVGHVGLVPLYEFYDRVNDVPGSTVHFFRHALPALNEKVLPPREFQVLGRQDNLGNVINILHSRAYWTRDAIILWLETDTVPEHPCWFEEAETSRAK